MATNDFCTREGALRLKERIEAYWKERGYDVNIELTEAGFMPAMRSAASTAARMLSSALRISITCPPTSPSES